MMVTKSNPYVGSSSRSDRCLENCGSGLCSCPCSSSLLSQPGVCICQ